MKKILLYCAIFLLLFTISPASYFAMESNEGEVEVSSDNNSSIQEESTDSKNEIDEELPSIEEKADKDQTEKNEANKVEVPKEEVQELHEQEEPKKPLLESKSIETIETTQLQTLETTIIEQKTSLLGHLNSKNGKIYSDLTNLQKFTIAGEEYTNEVYYIKLQAEMNKSIYYLLSREPSSEKGVVGWVKSEDLSFHTHVGVDKTSKTFYFKGTGSTYTKAWGGSKNVVHKNLSSYKNQAFQVHLTEKVGNNTWYRGILDGKTVWIHSSYVSSANESTTSKLGHIRNTNVKIYSTLGVASSAKTAGNTYTNKVYYIKKQSSINGELFYLISNQPSSVNGVVGWVKASDLSTHDHKGVDKKAKTFYLKGSGSAYSTAWGGSKDIVFKNLSQYKNQAFQVHLTETVGSNTWYRGTLNGKTVWIHSNYLLNIEENTTSKLGHIRNSAVEIYPSLLSSSSFKAGTTYTNQVYYIKKEAKVNGQLYNLISRQPSSVNGIVGWVKSSDLSINTHVGVDKKEKTFYIKGTGSAYNTAWGGPKNLVYNLSGYKALTFKVHLTEKVGNNIWYRGILEGKTVWIHNSYLTTTPIKEIVKTYKNYSLSLNEITDIQMKSSPMTDMYGTIYKLWLREDAFKKGSIVNGKGTVEGSGWNLRRGPGTSHAVYGKVNDKETLPIYNTSEKDKEGYIWYHVKNTTWGPPRKEDVSYFLNPNSFTSFKDTLQFLKLSQSGNIEVKEVNERILNGKGALSGQAQAFVDGGNANGINEIYLISHALLETGNGSSALSKGVVYNGKTVYNMYGIGAYDSCPLECGAKKAYDEGWFTPAAAIKGGAAFIGNEYIKQGLDTLYKMRWNPDYAQANRIIGKQYATDIGWAYKQTSKMNELYSLLDAYRITLEIPVYK